MRTRPKRKPCSLITLIIGKLRLAAESSMQKEWTGCTDQGQFMARGASRREIADQSNGIKDPWGRESVSCHHRVCIGFVFGLCRVCARRVLCRFCFCTLSAWNSEERSSFLDRLNALGRIMADLIHHRTNGRPAQPFIRARTYQFQ